MKPIIFKCKEEVNKGTSIINTQIAKKMVKNLKLSKYFFIQKSININ